MERSGLTRFVTPVEMLGSGVLKVAPNEPDALRECLREAGWVEDPLPGYRARVKPWVVWSARERRIGPALHLECEKEAFVVHIDVANPGRWWPLFVLHVPIDLWGWRTVRMWLLRLL